MHHMGTKYLSYQNSYSCSKDSSVIYANIFYMYITLHNNIHALILIMASIPLLFLIHLQSIIPHLAQVIYNMFPF